MLTDDGGFPATWFGDESGPPTVLYVDPDPATRDRVQSARPADLEIEFAGDAEAALERLEDVDCVLVAHPLEDGAAIDVVEAAAERDPPLPAFVRADDPPTDLHDRVTLAGGAGLFTDATGLEDLLERATEVAEGYREDRRRADHSDLLGALQELPVAVYAKDEEARHCWLTDVPEAPSPEEALGKTDLEVYGGTDEETARQGYEDDLEVIETGEPVLHRQERLEGVSEDGWEYVVWSLTTKVPWYEDGEVTGLVGVSADITEIKEQQQELEALERRFERFISFVNHDLKHPLTVARGYLDLAADTDDTEQLLEKVDDALVRMDDIIDNATTLAEEDGAGPFVSQVALGSVATAAWESTATNGGIFRSRVPDRAVITADRGQLQQLLENLFRNSIDHGTDSGVVDDGPVEVEVGVLEDGSGFYVADDGPGIPEEERDRVFEFGYKLDRGGSGIGLTIVQEVADAHGWDLEVAESEAGGARFEVRGCMLVNTPDRLVEDGPTVELAESRDVGDPVPGETSREGSRWMLTAGGTNVWQDDVEYRYAYVPVEGDARITARVANLDDVNQYSKAGVVVRGPDDDDPFGYVGLTGDHGSEVLWRTDPRGLVESKQFRDGASAPYWYRIDRRGRELTCSVSVDGDEWVHVDQQRVPLEDTVHLGLLVNGHDENERASATFDSVSVVESED